MWLVRGQGIWVVRRQGLHRLLCGNRRDQLLDRKNLGAAVKELVISTTVHLEPALKIDAIDREAGLTGAAN